VPFENFEHETTALIRGVLPASRFSLSPRLPHRRAKRTFRRSPSVRVGFLGLTVGDPPRLTRPRKQSPLRRAVCRPYVPFGSTRLFLTSLSRAPLAQRSRADITLSDSGTRWEILHPSRLQLTLRPAMRMSISNPLFSVIFWRPWNAVVPSPPAPPTTEPMPAPLPPPKMPPSSAPAPAPIAV
jgi:hypothetical protein